MLQPFDACPEDCFGCPDDDPNWQQQGDTLFRRIVGFLEEFNAEPANVGDEERELLTMLSGRKKEKSNAVLESELDQRLTGSGYAFAQALAPLAAIRRRAAGIASKFDVDRQSLLRRLLCLFATAALSVAFFEHWHSRNPHADGNDHPWLVHDIEGIDRTKFLAIGLAALVLSAWIYHCHLKNQAERRRHDARGIAEGLRVQFYWSLAGLGHSVAANYMQRQRNELSWIRFVISSVSFPYEQCWHGFKVLPAGVRHALLSIVHERWVRGQKEYYEDKAHKLLHKLHWCHVAGWSFASAGVLNVIGMFVLELSPQMRYRFESHFYRPSIVLGSLGAICLLFVWIRSRVASGVGRIGMDVDNDEEIEVPSGFVHWLLGRPATWGFGCLGAAFILPLPLLLARLPEDYPDWPDWWIILTGFLVLVAGLCLAWAERNFFSELSHQYRAMRHLYAAADHRLEYLLGRLKKVGDGSPEAAHIQGEIQEILYKLGCEAQDENAEWLMLHRARPLEPFLA